MECWQCYEKNEGGIRRQKDPFSESGSWSVLFPLVCGFFVALRDLAIRYVPASIPSPQVAFTNAWIIAAGGGLLSVFQGWGTADWYWYAWFFALAGALYCGHLLLIVGSRSGELSLIGPFRYISILIAISYGYWIWGDLPTVIMLTGALVIVVSGIILVSSEKRKARQASLATRF